VVVNRIASILSALAFLLAAAGAFAAEEPAPASKGLVDWAQVPEYRIVPGDELHFNFGPPTPGGIDQVRVAKVRPDGRVTVFPVGDIVAAGRTPAEIQSDLLRLLSSEYKLPRVTVEVSELAGNQVHVLGRVKQPGSQPVGPFTTLLQAIAGAGGFEDDASRNSVMVMHREGAGDVRVARIKVDRLLKSGADIPLSRFDIVYVPRTTIGNVDVFVQQFFSQTAPVLNFGMLGWELFNLDRVFMVRATTAQ
jgi:polysaccharide export outer membrane protein